MVHKITTRPYWENSNLCKWYEALYLVGRKGIFERYLGPVFCTAPCFRIPAAGMLSLLCVCSALESVFTSLQIDVTADVTA